MTKQKKTIIIGAISLILSIAAIVSGCAIYIADFYRAERRRYTFDLE